MMKVIKLGTLVLGSVVFLLGPTVGYCQYYQFSQYNFADQRVNPAVVASSDEASVNFLFRNQQTGGDFGINTTFVSASYPLITSKGRRWSGIGVSLSDDRTGGVFSTQEASISYAANVPLSKWQSFSLGLKGMYMQRRINLDGLVTGMQYISDRGFDEGAHSGESIADLNTHLLTLSMGGLWQQVDRQRMRVAYVGFSFFDFNKANDSFLEPGRSIRGTFVGTAGVRVAHRGPLNLLGEMLVTNGYQNTVFNVGLVTQYALKQDRNAISSRVDLITKYVPGRSGIIGVQLHKENFSFGVSYDFPIIVTNYGNTGALEFGFSLHRLVDPRARRRTKRERPTAESSKGSNPKEVVVRQTSQTNKESPADSVTKKSVTLSESIKQKKDSVATSGFAGQIRHEPVVLEKAQLHFNFEFNSSDLDGESLDYLDEVATVLAEDELLSIKLTGHTDNVGSPVYNQRLSLKRAQAVQRYLVDKGVNPDRITVEGKGMLEPLEDNGTEEGRAVNRRVEIQIVY